MTTPASDDGNHAHRARALSRHRGAPSSIGDVSRGTRAICRQNQPGRAGRTDGTQLETFPIGQLHRAAVFDRSDDRGRSHHSPAERTRQPGRFAIGDNFTRE
jgi:hypothetical protein